MKDYLLMLVVIAVLGLIIGGTVYMFKPLEKPFVITKKYETKPHWYFEYQDANGKERYFWDATNKYNVGDTIK